MNKLENLIVCALRANRSANCGNTSVICEEGKKTVFLCGNDIYKEEHGKKFFSFCGKDTQTTRSRLRALGVDIVSKDGKRFYNGKQITNFHGWNLV